MTTPEQAAFDFEAAAPPRDRLFFALRPPPETALRLAKLALEVRQDLGLSGALVAAQRLHVTLQAWPPRAGVSEAFVARLCEAAAGVAAAPFALGFSLVGGAFGNPVRPPLVLRGHGEEVAPVLAFRRRLADALSAAGLAPEPVADFTPHVTLLYGDRTIPPGGVDPVGWTVRDFVLIRSLVGLGRHAELGRWTLAG